MAILASPARTLVRWADSLKFQIVVLTIVASVLSAIGTASLMLRTTQADLQRVLLTDAAEESERTAALLSSKLEMLQVSLGAVAHQVPAQAWDEPAAMTRFLLDKPALGVLFDSIFAARPDGAMTTRIERGAVGTQLPNLADREYFKRALATDQPVVSLPVTGRVSGTPIVVMAISVRAADGSVRGVVAGSIALGSTSLFSNLAGSRSPHGAAVLVIDRRGTILSHPEPGRVMQSALAEPGLAQVVGLWIDSGSPIDTRGSATLSLDYLVAMAGIPLSDWAVVGRAPQAAALEAVDNARRTAWLAASAVGLLAGALAGVLAWLMTRPISRLRERAVGLLAETGTSALEWPAERGEVGELALAFQRVVAQRGQRERETQALLLKVQAVLDHADMGIALSRDGRFEFVSAHFCRMLGCEMAQAVGQPTRFIYPSDEAYQALAARATPAFMARGAFDGELELQRCNGETFWAQMRGRAVVPGDRSKGAVWLIDDVTAVRAQRERLAWDSSHDSLTGLANRAAFTEVLQRATTRAAEEPFCALFIDLDRFKIVNDTGGHAAGDAMLRSIARVLEAQVRQSDTVARLGGDEFAVLLHRCPAPIAHTIAEKLRRAVLGCELAFETRTYAVGASIGLVAVDGSYADFAEVLKVADAACYEAKRQGRDQVSALPARAASPAAPAVACAPAAPAVDAELLAISR